MSETGLVYTFTTPKLQPLVTKAEGKNLIQVSRASDTLFCGVASPQTCGQTSRVEGAGRALLSSPFSRG